ncbi:hypothetical protein A2801_02280 [Candidatus Woesebacteria bacterium RIFCSPHIGHO2_01_FULL_41_10]|uniref:YokE-like PH domain-containing protein n=1 Tax=Candidatus Woesebacteria bacterium RIFCSPHIGHO2_01_FULL_41_10 TaxID=1802500 RepID=A0A1F7YQ42_9BACT|nr:MAG: hypothetical protein A2801_02280 [Candidatus Woesebacteria bacterium RIFCSPHIGHO2_01_FULL_41_10]
MNTALLKTRCTKGHLVVYEDKVSTELGGFGVKNENSLLYSQITGVEIKTTMAKIPLLSKGVATVKIFGKGEQVLECGMVNLDDAVKAKELIESRIKS